MTISASRRASLSRRALARISITVTRGYRRGTRAPRGPMARPILAQSDSVSRPLRIFVESTFASLDRIRWVSSLAPFPARRRHRPSGLLGDVGGHARPERGVVKVDVGGHEVLQPGHDEVDDLGRSRVTISVMRSQRMSGDAHHRSWSSSSASASRARCRGAGGPVGMPVVARGTTTPSVDLGPRQFAPSPS